MNDSRSSLSSLLGEGSRSRAEMRPAIMGVVNITPDSFFDGGKYDGEALFRHIDELLEQGADLLDIGGESSRPGSRPVSAEEQMGRIGDAIAHAVRRGAFVSVDTTNPEVADRALSLGARMVNDVSCLATPELARVAARHHAALVISHSRGPMSQMPGFSEWPDSAYNDIVDDVVLDWERARRGALDMGIEPDKIVFDPGLGFSKNARHCFVLLHRLTEFKKLGVPLLVGPGRKSFIAAVDPSPPEGRLGGTIAACIMAAQRGADFLRVHDVQETRQALRVCSAVQVPPPLSATRAGPNAPSASNETSEGRSG